MTNEAMHAVRRFGFGRRGNEALPQDPRAWLRAQLDGADPALARSTPSTRNSMDISNQITADQQAHRPLTMGGLSNFSRLQLTATLWNAVTTRLPFRERLVWFWANHFTIAIRADPWTLDLAAAYIQEAIRPCVTASFTDMLKAVMRHPAMLVYLSNRDSVGPHSRFGLAHHSGLNENLARESLELHTLGIHGGYTQRDVTTYAAVLTGRRLNYSGPDEGYVFDAGMHEPGGMTVMGHAFPEGYRGSEDVLTFLGHHPATYRHIATQLVQHFVADDPPPACIDRVVAVLAATGGNLKQASLALIDLPQAWQPMAKFRAPAEYVIAVARALNLPMEPDGRLWAATDDLGQPFMNALLPNGWPDTAADWATGEAILKRADYAMFQAVRPGAPAAQAALEASIGDICSSRTRNAVQRAANPAEALATVLVSPEFLRR
jgi:uncharacterized protein (DUF1800 family)